MQYTQRLIPPKLIYGLLALTGLAGLALWTLFHSTLTGPSSFMPHRTCYLNDSGLIWLHVSSDSLIGLAYVSISLTLAYLVHVARVPFHLAFIAFGVFIGACGATHFMEVWTVYEPHYWLAGGIKVLTAIASVATAVWLFPLLPQAISLVKSTELAEERRVKLESAHKELQQLYGKVKELDTLKTQFFSNVSHELRTPLVLILGPAEKLSRSADLTESQRADLQLIERNARMLLKHVNELLDIAKLDAGKLKPEYSDADLAQTLRVLCSNFNLLAQEKKVAHTIKAPQSLVAQVDLEKVERIILNLVSNAFKHVPEGGKIECEVARNDGKVVISVDDNGPGIPADQREAVFERFRQLDGGVRGTGLGLSIVKEFAALHRGKAFVTQSPFGGARFVVELPLRAPEGEKINARADNSPLAAGEFIRPAVEPLQARPAQESQSAAGSADAPTVLLAEDNSDLRHFLGDALAAHFRVTQACDGQDALEKATAAPPDLVLTDLMMPRMNGEVLLSKLRGDDRLKHIPVVLLTANADEAIRLKLLREGAQDYLTKPVSIEEMLARVKNHVSLKRTREILQAEVASAGDNLESLAKTLALNKREVDQAREQAEQANRAKDEFLATLSHELRTPLTVVLGWTRLLQSTKLDEDAQTRAIGIIQRSARAQVQLVEDLLDMSRIVTGRLKLNLQPIEVWPLIEAAAENLRPAMEAKQQTLTLNLAREGCTLLGDPDRLQQIFHNLLSNAVKFTPAAGKIEVSLQARDGVHLRVTDSGVGIAPDFLPHLFKRFQQADGSVTRRFGGMGLGLAIVRHLVELQGGTVRAESPGEGKGATFIVSFPAFKEELLRSNPRKAEKTASHDSLLNLKVLVVEDDDDTRAMVKTILESYGAKITTASSASAAIAALDSALPDVVVSDISMPDEDGYSLIRKIRARTPEKGGRLPALAVTAYADRKEEQQMLIAAGFQGFVAKPADPEDITSSVARLAGRS